jgi:two-component system KDP operon response regulator KdpE
MGQWEQDPVEPLVLGDLPLDLAHRRVTLAAQKIHVTPIEYRLLVTLIKYAGKAITQRQLLIQVWRPAYAELAQYIRVYMGQLRRRLEADPTRSRYLLTEQGVGYRLGGE